MKKVTRQWIVLLITGIIIFYGIPMCAKLLPPDSGMFFFVLVLLILYPIYSFLSSLLFTASNGFLWYLPIFIGVLFAPSIFVFYNSTASIYIIVYAAASLIGSSMGYFIHRRQIKE